MVRTYVVDTAHKAGRMCGVRGVCAVSAQRREPGAGCTVTPLSITPHMVHMVRSYVVDTAQRARRMCGVAAMCAVSA